MLDTNPLGNPTTHHHTMPGSDVRRVTSRLIATHHTFIRLHCPAWAISTRYTDAPLARALSSPQHTGVRALIFGGRAGPSFQGAGR